MGVNSAVIQFINDGASAISHLFAYFGLEGCEEVSKVKKKIVFDSPYPFYWPIHIKSNMTILYIETELFMSSD